MFKRNRGFQLTGLIIAGVLLVLIIVALGMFYTNTIHFLNPSINYSKAQKQAGLALAHMGKQIRQFESIFFQDPDGDDQNTFLSGGQRLVLKPLGGLDFPAYRITADGDLMFTSSSGDDVQVATGITQLVVSGLGPRLDGAAGAFKGIKAEVTAEDPEGKTPKIITLSTSGWCLKRTAATVPIINSIVPPSCPVNQTPDATIDGDNFFITTSNDVIVYIGDNPADPQSGPGNPTIFADTQTLNIEVPPHGTAETVDVVAINPDGSFSLLEDGFTYTTAALPSVYNFNDVSFKWFEDGSHQARPAGSTWYWNVYIAGPNASPNNSMTKVQLALSNSHQSGPGITRAGYYYVRVKGEYESTEPREDYKISVNDGSKSNWAEVNDPGAGVDGWSWVNIISEVTGDNAGKFYFEESGNTVTIEYVPGQDDNSSVAFGESQGQIEISETPFD